MLLILVLITGVTKQNFFSLKNLSNISVNTACRVIIAFGVCGCLITKRTDLSAGRVVGLAACISGTLLQKANYSGKFFPTLGELNPFLVLLITIILCAVIGIINGLIIALVVGLVMWFIFNMTRHGKYMYAIGGNEAAAEVSSVNVRKTKVMIYMSAAILYAIAGFLLGAKSGGSSVNMGQGYELEAIAACTIGGVSVNGGIGRISGCVIGVLVFELLRSSMQFLGIENNYQYIVQGVVIVVAIALDIRKYIQKK